MCKEKKLLSFTEMKRLRAKFGKHIEKLKVPYLLDIQIKSYENFIQNKVKDSKKRKNKGLEEILKNIFPIYNDVINLEYISYNIGKCVFNTSECKNKGLTYSAPLKIKIKLSVNDKFNKIRSVTEDVYILDIPLMTLRGTFIINGTERVVVSQLHRSPGVFFEVEKNKQNTSENVLYTAKIIPQKGAWLDIEFDSKNCIFVRIDKKRKFLLTILLRAFGFSAENILNMFTKHKIVYINDKIFIKNIIKNKNKIIIDKNEINEDYLIDKIIINNIKNKKNRIIIKSNTKITKNIIEILKKEKIIKIKIIDPDNAKKNIYIINSLNIDTNRTQLEAMMDIYKILRPGELPTKESATKFINSLFFSEEKYDLSLIGRMKFNKRIDKKHSYENKTLSKKDIIQVVKKLIDIKSSTKFVDDIDHLGNRKIRSVGEITENQFKIGLIRVEKSIRDKLSSVEHENVTPQDLINGKPIATIIREFFCSSQLSQFMDQNNPLSEITHKRRISALGPGGLTRERAGFEVRDVHNTHYGRICPIETPEGQNIGLINSLAIYARSNKYGFLETPYLKVIDKKITNTIEYLSAIEESKYIIAQANEKINKNSNKLDNEFVSCRFKNEFLLMPSNKVKYIDVSPRQIVSVAAALIPFLEHNDANRALMGSNMQRQAVPVLKAEKPLVGTGMERLVAKDSGATVIAKRGGIVDKADATRIIIRVNSNEIKLNESGVDIYNLIKFTRSNQNTCINQKPLVRNGDIIKKEDIIADGPATDLGELALGQNLFVAFMPWNGYNFEDSIIISENVIKENKFTSIHIEELTCTARDLKLGPEEITSDIPNVGSSTLSSLDKSGIIYIGAKVNPNDILVGKVTQKGESQLTPEEKLLQAIFGEKASNVKDSSLRVPSGIKGTVIDVQIFTREGIKKDLRTLEIEEMKFKSIKKDLNDELRILKQDVILQAKNLCTQLNLKTEMFNNYNKMDQFLHLNLENEIDNKKLKIIKSKYYKLIDEYTEKIKIKEKKIKQSDELTPGVVRTVKVSIAIKRHLQPGDKISGRHGNKGVVSIIVPAEDMPYSKDGTIIDIILNPLGVPSRMNIGQVLETHLGWAAKESGKILETMLNKKHINYDNIRKFLSKIYNMKKFNIDFYKFNNEELLILSKNLRKGIPIATPVFDGITESEIKALLNLSNLPKNGKTYLYDGRTGMKFDNPTTVGYKYIMKLNHLIDDKIHARSTGSYSLVSQQPLGGKAQFGGQRFGEMEVWALEAYGAAYTLQEMLTIKSDDISGRTKIYKNMIDNNYNIETSIPEAFNVLSKEILSLGLNIELEDEGS